MKKFNGSTMALAFVLSLVPAPAAFAQEGQPPQSAPAAQTFTGQILKAGDELVFKDPNTNSTYRLDDQEKVKRFEGQTVTIQGTYNARNKTIHVEDIRPA